MTNKQKKKIEPSALLANEEEEEIERRQCAFRAFSFNFEHKKRKIQKIDLIRRETKKE